ncbi:sulfotransferase family protein [bacterium]|nr:sulfotransferase family protein [bacterium]
MIISHRLKLIFICNGKTGTTSLEAALNTFNDVDDINGGMLGLYDNKHMPAVIAKSLLPASIWNTYFKFAIVRNPYSWFISNFEHNFRSRLSLKKVIRHPMLAHKMISRELESRIHRNKRVITTEDVEFFHHYLRQYRALPLMKTLYQHSYVHDMDGNNLLDFVGKIESLDIALAHIQKCIGYNFTIPHINRTIQGNKRKVLDDSARIRVQELWRRDFDSFEYSID